MKIWGYLWILVMVVFFSSAAIVTAMNVYYVDSNGQLYQKNYNAINYVDYSGRRPSFKVTGPNIRFRYQENYGEDYSEFMYWLDNVDAGNQFFRRTVTVNDYETDFDDGHSDCNWNERYGDRYNTINNCYIE